MELRSRRREQQLHPFRNGAELDDGSPFSGHPQESSALCSPSIKSNGKQQQPKWKSSTAVATAVNSVVYLLCVSFVAWGVLLCWTRLYTAEECDMTWSHRVWMEIRMASSSSSSSPYRLYKFMDGRDPRQVHLLALPPPLHATDGWCGSNTRNNSTTTTVAVLYIPGHGGSYEQSRSLGAHGLQLSRRSVSKARLEFIQRALMDGQWTGTTALDESEFIYDVYSVDFSEEPSGLHGQFIRDQANFVAEAVHHLTTTCGLSQIFLVAHSIGGYAARLAAANPKVRSRIRNLITLGTPHAHPVLAWESSMHEIHSHYLGMHPADDDHYTKNDNLAIISISGGLRDEMIPPTSCRINNHDTNSITLMASDYMAKTIDEGESKTPLLGMDHRAIVWCHTLLVPVRSILHSLVRSDVDNGSASALQRIQAVKRQLSLDDNDNNDFDNMYKTALEKQHSTLRQLYGFWASLAMETSLLYNAEWLVRLYTMIGIWNYVLTAYHPHVSSAFTSIAVETFGIPFLASCQCWLQQNYCVQGDGLRLSFASILILAGAASAILSLVRNIVLERLLRGRLVQHRLGCRVVALVVAAALLVGRLLFPETQQHSTRRFQPSGIVGLVLIVGIFLLCFTLVGSLPARQDGTGCPVTSSPRSWKVWVTRLLGQAEANSSQLSADRLTRLMALLLPLLPFLLAGDLVWIFLRGRVYPSLWHVTTPLVTWLTARQSMGTNHLFRIKAAIGQWQISAVVQTIRFFIAVFGGSNLFQRGHPQTILNLLSTLLFLDMIEVLPFLVLTLDSDSQLA